MTIVSVIIPTYNHAAYLPDAINSVLAQTAAGAEIVVVDDGSTDNTAGVAAAFGDAIHYHYQENRGLSAARNAGLARATGRYITVLDADDLLEPDYLATMIAALEADGDAGAAYCGFRMIDPANRPLFQRGLRGMPPGQLYETLLYGNFIVPPCVLARREVYNRAGSFDESLRACEDWDMWLRIAAGHNMIPVAACLVRYRVQPGSMSADPERMLASRLAVLEKERSRAGEARRRRAAGYVYRITAIEWIQAGQEERALDCMARAAGTYPPLLGELETFYELAFWDQPKGERGDTRRVDVAANAARMSAFLERFFNHGETTAEIQAYRSLSRALTWEALGMISYGRREMASARRYFASAIAASPRKLADRKFASLMVKSLIGGQYSRPRPVFEA